MDKQLVVFQVANERYGVDIYAMESIVRLQPVTAMPHAPAFVEGVINLRGTVLPVIDLHKRFGLPPQEPTKDTRIVVAEMPGMAVGIKVDAVLEVRSVPEGNVELPSPLVATVDAAFITGIAKVEEEGLIIVLDLEKLLSPEERADLVALQWA